MAEKGRAYNHAILLSILVVVHSFQLRARCIRLFYVSFCLFLACSHTLSLMMCLYAQEAQEAFGLLATPSMQALAMQALRHMGKIC